MRPTAPRRLPLVAEQSGWREYFYPETLEHADGVVQGTLRNLLGERDDERLTALGRFTMRWSAVTPRQWSAACAHAMPAPGSSCFLPWPCAHTAVPAGGRYKTGPHDVAYSGAFSGASSRNTQCPCRGGLGAREEVGAVSKPRGRSRRGKGTARKVSEILNSIARLVRAVSVLVDALGRWLS